HAPRSTRRPPGPEGGTTVTTKLRLDDIRRVWEAKDPDLVRLVELLASQRDEPPEKPIRYGAPHGYSAGRRPDHGASASSAAATRSTRPSAPRRPASCKPSGSPSSVQPHGIDTVG